MSTFNSRRFVQTVKWTEVMSLNGSVRQVIIGAIILFLMAIFISPIDALIEDPVMWASGTVVPVFYFFFIGMGCTVLGRMGKHNQDRLSTLMLPASQTEKFLARLLHVTLGTALISLAALVIADVLQTVYYLVVDGHAYSSMTVNTINALCFGWPRMENDNDSLMPQLTIMLMVVCAQSVFVLGGVFFRRAQLALTMLVCFLCMILLGHGAVQLISADTSFEIFAHHSVDQRTFISCLDAFFVAVTLFNYWLSYLVFKHIQLINNKWINL